jgi:hypothetical protein
MKPVTVTLAYDPSKLPSGLSPSSLVIYTAPDGSSTYSPLPSSVADGTHISATTTHFSTDGVFAPSGGGDDAASPVDATSGSDVDVGSDGGSAEDGGVPKDATTGKDSSSDATTPDGSSGDAAAIKDSAVDTGASCPLSCGADASIGSSVCTCDTACGGHSYQILCTMPGNACFCKKDGTQTMTFTGSSSSTEDLCGASYAECTFPGTLPTVGDSGSPHGDAGTTKDAGASCPLSCGEDAGSSSSACTCEATCGGHSYELLCTTPGNLCVCKEDGAQTMSFTGTTSSTETLCGANYMGCGYPGSM